MNGEYLYRRRLSPTEMLPAVAVGLGVGLLGMYVARLMLQRTPLVPRSGPTRALVRARPPQPPRAPQSPASRKPAS